LTVLVLTDTAASLAPADAAAHGVRLVPLTVIVAGQAYRDTELDLAALPSGRPTTSGPPPGEFLAALGDSRGGAVIVTVAATLSSTNASARAAAALTSVPIEVVDSRSAAGGQALVALAAAECARAGGQVADVAAAARAATAEVHLVGCLPSLDGLARTGRVPGLAAAAARGTGLQFMFTLRRGGIRPMRPAASPAAAAERMVELCASTRSPGQVVELIALGNADELQRRLDALADEGRLPIGHMLTASFGTAITLYTGPQVTGLAWRWRATTAEHT
jgi:DegV family protein with EDD domain